MTHPNFAVAILVYVVGYFGTVTLAYYYTDGKDLTFKTKQDFFKICLVWPVCLAAMFADFWERGEFELPDWIFRLGRILYLTWPMYPMLAVAALGLWICS